jgi:hypothetical protein
MLLGYNSVMDQRSIARQSCSTRRADQLRHIVTEWRVFSDEDDADDADDGT